MDNVRQWAISLIPLIVNSNNETLIDAYPDSNIHDVVFGLINDTATLMSFPIYFDTYGYMYDIVGPYPYPHNITSGSSTYNLAEENAISSLLHSGVYVNTLAKYTFELYNSTAGVSNLTFEEFVDQLYVEFNLEELFPRIFRVMYEELYTSLTEYSKNLYEETDMTGLTLDYLRWVKMPHGSESNKANNQKEVT